MVSQCLSKVQVTKGRSADMAFKYDDDDLLPLLPPRRLYIKWDDGEKTNDEDGSALALDLPTSAGRRERG